VQFGVHETLEKDLGDGLRAETVIVTGMIVYLESQRRGPQWIEDSGRNADPAEGARQSRGRSLQRELRIAGDADADHAPRSRDSLHFSQRLPKEAVVFQYGVA